MVKRFNEVAVMKTDARVLIIDDNVNLAKGFALALEHAGYHVAVAHTADVGLQLAAEQPPDAILLDFRMPFVNGVGFLYRLRELPGLREVPVMVITGGTVSQETLADLRDLNASLRFKPLALPQLVEETRALVAARDISQALHVKEGIRQIGGSRSTARMPSRSRSEDGRV